MPPCATSKTSPAGRFTSRLKELGFTNAKENSLVGTLCWKANACIIVSAGTAVRTIGSLAPLPTLAVPTILGENTPRDISRSGDGEDRLFLAGGDPRLASHETGRQVPHGQPYLGAQPVQSHGIDLYHRALPCPTRRLSGVMRKA